MRAAFVSVLALSLAAFSQAEITGTPDTFAAERYAKMREKSPFALATPAAAAPAPKAAAFTEGMYLGGHGVFQTEAGVDVPWVSIKTKDAREHLTLEGTEPNEEGISIASYEPSPIIGKSKVILKKGNEFGEVKQDEAGLAAARTQAAVQAETQMQRPPNGKPLPPSNRATRTINIPRPNVAPQGQNAQPVPQAQITPPPPGGGSQVNVQQPQTGPAVQRPPARRVRVISSQPN